MIVEKEDLKDMLNNGNSDNFKSSMNVAEE